MRTSSAPGCAWSDEALGLELRRAVVHDRPRLRVLCVGRALLAVEDEVGGEMDESSARAVGRGGNRVAAADDRLRQRRAALHVRRVDDDLRAMSHQDTLDRSGVAHVELDGVAVRRRRPELRRDHVEAALDGLPADLGAEVAGPAGDEELHRTIVTGPSFTSSTAIAAPKTPRATGTPSASRSAQKRS